MKGNNVNIFSTTHIPCVYHIYHSISLRLFLDDDHLTYMFFHMDEFLLDMG